MKINLHLAPETCSDLFKIPIKIITVASCLYVTSNTDLSDNLLLQIFYKLMDIFVGIIIAFKTSYFSVVAHLGLFLISLLLVCWVIAILKLTEKHGYFTENLNVNRLFP